MYNETLKYIYLSCVNIFSYFKKKLYFLRILYKHCILTFVIYILYNSPIFFYLPLY